MKFRSAAVAGVSLLGAVAIALPGVAGGNKYASTTDFRDCGDEDLVNFVGPIKLWPPNHKFVNEQVAAVDGNGDNVALTLIINVLDTTGGDGGSNHDPDYTPAEPADTGSGEEGAVVPFQLRAERSGKGDGRTYTIDWVAKFDNGTKTCASNTDESDAQTPFVVTVPHDMRGGADWK